jgi:hypothetical protein
LSFAVARGSGAVLALTDEQFEAIIVEAFARWMNVDCGGGLRPGFEIRSAGLVQAPAAFFCETEPLLNVGVWWLSDQWHDDESGDALGSTRSVFARETGELLDADVVLNAERIQREYPPSQWHDALLPVATHEAGHFLGLAHSADTGSVMQAFQGGDQLLQQRLGPDDEAAICALYPPRAESYRCAEPGVADAMLDERACAAMAHVPASAPASCSLAPRRASAWGVGVWVCLSLSVWVARRRLFPGVST